MVRNKNIWVFDGGAKFLDNPKYYFIYINKFRKNIKAIWLCRTKELKKEIQKLGYKAVMFNSKKGKYYQQKAGVYVVNQVRNGYPTLLKGATILNLWHGVGCKSIEKKLKDGRVFNEVARKYITNNELFYNNQIFLVTSPLMEKHFIEQVGLKPENVIRGGYPSNIKKFEVKTFDHNIKRNLPDETKVVLYCPTFREKQDDSFILNSLPDMEKLHEVLEKKKMLLILKLHPLMESEPNYINIKEKYKDYPYFCFWKENEDIYEIFDQIDLAIVDYSSMFYNLLAAGVTDFIRYIYDYDDKENVRDLVFDYKEMTYGEIANNFDELIKLLNNYKKGKYSDKKNAERIYKLFWDYSKESSFDDIYEFTMSHKINYEKLPELHSFDIFDTLIKRKGGLPISIFALVEEKIRNSNIESSNYFKRNFITIRRNEEANLRQLIERTNYNKQNKIWEITLDQIYELIGHKYNIDSKDIQQIKQWEIEAELENCEPIEENIKKVHKLLEDKQDVVLISDMYLPKNIITEMLNKVDKKIGKLPLYLSCETNSRKKNGMLYYDVYKDLNYNYSSWIHTGDNEESDFKQAKAIGIKPVLYENKEFSDYEIKLIERINSSDSYLVANKLKEYRIKHDNYSNFIFSHLSFIFVPYVMWVIDNAIENKYKTLYFVSRDGEILKKIADTIIKENKLDIKTKYFYGSRVAWRIPSFIKKIDEEYYENFGVFNGGIQTYEQLIKATSLTKEEFDKFFPTINYKSDEKVTWKVVSQVRDVLRKSKEYEEIILKLASEKRKNVIGYLKQEIDFNEKFAFVEYWARGYTQDCLTRLIKEASNNKIENSDFYYLRSIYPSNEHNIRHNFTNQNITVTFVESILSNLPYDSVKQYKKEKGKYVPEIKEIDYEEKFYNETVKAFQEMAKQLATINWYDKNASLKEIYSFAANEFLDEKNIKMYTEFIAPLKYTGWLNGETSEFAPKITLKYVMKAPKGEKFIQTNSKEMTMLRTNKFVYYLYILKTRGIFKTIQRKIKKIKDK